MNSPFDFYWMMIDGTDLLLALAVLLPLEFLFPVTPIPFRKRVPALLFITLTAPLFKVAMKAVVALSLGIGFSDGKWLSADSIPKPSLDFLPQLYLGTFFENIPFPGAVFGLLILFFSDGVMYWWHRATHTIPLLWPLHKSHHWDENLNVLTLRMDHPLHGPFFGLFSGFLTPYLILCAGSHINPSGAWDVFLTYVIAHKLQGWFTHSNLKISFGPFAWLFTGPHLHRLHHAKENKFQNSNYANMFPVWDVFFGTYIAPKKGEWPEVGIEDGPLPSSQLQLVFQPFADWWRYLRGLRKSSAPVLSRR